MRAMIGVLSHAIFRLVSISELRVLLLRDEEEVPVADMSDERFNLRIESLVIESTNDDVPPFRPI